MLRKKIHHEILELRRIASSIQNCVDYLNRNMRLDAEKLPKILSKSKKWIKENIEKEFHDLFLICAINL